MNYLLQPTGNSKHSKLYSLLNINTFNNNNNNNNNIKINNKINNNNNNNNNINKYKLEIQLPTINIIPQIPINNPFNSSSKSIIPLIK